MDLDTMFRIVLGYFSSLAANWSVYEISMSHDSDKPPLRKQIDIVILTLSSLCPKGLVKLQIFQRNLSKFTS